MTLLDRTWKTLATGFELISLQDLEELARAHYPVDSRASRWLENERKVRLRQLIEAQILTFDREGA